MLSKTQGIFYAAAVAGHNIVLTGQGGSGKSYVLAKFAADMIAKGKMLQLHAVQALQPQISQMVKLCTVGVALGMGV